MSPAEIVHRVVEKHKRVLAKGRMEGWARYGSPGMAPHLDGLAALVLRLAQERHAAIATEADDVLAGRYSALGRAWPQRDPVHLFPADLWQLDPVSLKHWPGSDQYCFDISYRHERERGDIKYVWEINRLQFLQPLAARARLGGDARALAEIENAIESWHGANPPFRGIAWNSGIEIALRAISLLVVSSLLGEKLSENTTRRLRSVLAASLVWLKRYPSRHSSANNHLIAEAAAEYLVGVAMPELPGAAKAAEDARKVLDCEALKQILPDGVPAEQSPTYGAFSAEFLAVVHAVSPLASATWDRLQAFAAFIAWLSDADGVVPAIGDDDEGRVLALGVSHGRYAADISRRIAPFGERQGHMTFSEGGYSVVRQDGWHLVFDHGPLGYLSIAAHGHADALSFTLTHKGRALIVDPGTYLYHSGGDWRDWFRGTAAHNTLRVGGADQSCIAGPFNWSKKAIARQEQTEPGASWSLAASHDGYVASFGVRHHRGISSDGKLIVILDQLIGPGAPREAEIAFQFAPGLEVAVGDGDCLILEDGRPLAKLRFPQGGRITTFFGNEPSAGGGWTSPAFGIKVQAYRLVWTGDVGHGGVTTTIEPKEGLI